MEYVRIGKEKIKVSRIGFGTGSSGFTGVNQQTRLTAKELATLLAYAYENGINFWDTGYSYGTHPHIAEALKGVARGSVVIATKFSDSIGTTVEKKLAETLRTFKTDYIDICLVHGIRNSFEIKMRSGAIEAMIRAKEKGYIRMLGASAHGIGAIEACLDLSELCVLFSRVNWSGASMDSYQENFLSKFVAVPFVKEVARKIVPKTFVPSLSAQVESMQSSKGDQEIVKSLLMKYKRGGKSIVGMKIFGAGKLTDEIDKSIGFIMSQEYIDSFLLGMISKEEVYENLRVYRKYLALQGTFEYA